MSFGILSGALLAVAGRPVTIELCAIAVVRSRNKKPKKECVGTLLRNTAVCSRATEEIESEKKRRGPAE
jgi:hypothetical protein